MVYVWDINSVSITKIVCFVSNLPCWSHSDSLLLLYISSLSLSTYSPNFCLQLVEVIYFCMAFCVLWRKVSCDLFLCILWWNGSFYIYFYFILKFPLLSLQYRSNKSETVSKFLLYIQHIPEKLVLIIETFQCPINLHYCSTMWCIQEMLLTAAEN